MSNVVVIKLWNSNLEKLWDGVKNFKKLKILDVAYSSSLTKTGCFIGLENLEELRLSKCRKLEELDSSIGCLQKLVKLDLRECKRLKRFSWEMIGKLTSLQQLNLYNCTNIPDISHEVGSLCQLHHLTELDLSYCTNLKWIPSLPPSVKFLDMGLSINLVNLPSNCSELQFLTMLHLYGCSKLGSEGFTQVTGLRNLRVLDMSNCNVSQVSSRIENLVSLVDLNLSKNTFRSLPESFSNLSKLQKLNISDCSLLQLLPPLPSQLREIAADKCWSLDVMPFDSVQKAYIFPSKVFKESLTSTKELLIRLSGDELHEWCTYRNSGNVLSFVAPIHFDSKICGLILCATIDEDGHGVEPGWEQVAYPAIYYPAIYNKTKGTSHRFPGKTIRVASMIVMFYSLNDTTLVVEAGDTVEVKFNDDDHIKSCGLRLVYEDDVVDSGLIMYDDGVNVNDDDDDIDDDDDDDDDR